MNMTEHTCNAVLTVCNVDCFYFYVLDKNMLALRYVTCVTLFYTHLEQDDINPEYKSEIIDEKTN